MPSTQLGCKRWHIQPRSLPLLVENVDVNSHKREHYQRALLSQVGREFFPQGFCRLTKETKRSGYINQGPDCGSLFTTTMTSVTVYSESDSSPTIGFVPPGTAVLSAVHVLHQASDLSVLPAPVSAIPSTGELSTGSIAGIVIGAVVAALLLVGAAWYVWHWKRRSTAQKTQKDGSGGLGELHGEDSHRQELPTEERVGEVAGSNVAIELPNAHTAKPRPPVELPG